MNPSEHWARFERWEVAKELRRQRHELLLPENAGGDPSSESTRYKLADLDERIRFVEQMPTSFLEANRNDILNGKLLPR